MLISISLWYAGHEAALFRDVADRFNIKIFKLHDIIKNVSLFLSNMSESVIKWPNEQKKSTILGEFEATGFPGALGVIDGSHVRIDPPSEDPVSYFNRNKFYSIHLQAVCDSQNEIRDIFIGYPGAVHDARVFRNSPLASTLEEKCRDKFILGDSAYPLKINLLKPYQIKPNMSATEINFNKKLSQCRILIEHTFGILKQKFRQLDQRNIETICHFIRACCVLHNLSQDNVIENMDIGESSTAEMTIELDNEDSDSDDDNRAHNAVAKEYRNYIVSL